MKNLNKSPATRSAVDVAASAFDTGAEELRRTWHSSTSHVFTINSYTNGVTFSGHTQVIQDQALGVIQTDALEPLGSGFVREHFDLRFKDTRDYMLPDGKYFLFKENPIAALEKRLSQLHEQGVLKSSVFYFGTTTDPFHSFHKKFDMTMGVLELLEQYRPGLLVVQTRSPMVISALPTLKILGDKVVVALYVETKLERAVSRYMPGQPKISERLLAADGLRMQGIEVNAVVSPILPYGDFYRDAWTFADTLVEHSDYVSFGCLACGRPVDETALRGLAVAEKLVSDREFRILRPYAYRNVYGALKLLAPEKLLLPVKLKAAPSQLNLFEAA